MAQKHLSTYIKKAASEILIPLGLKQTGLSRLWIDDHGWWLILVEFQPSGFSGGLYLNVGVHWLWYPQEHFSFDYGYRVESSFPLAAESNSSKSIQRIGELAAKEVQRYRELFPTVNAVALELAKEGSDSIWTLYHSAVAAGIGGYMNTARKNLSTLTLTNENDMESDWVLNLKRLSHGLMPLLDDTERFKEFVISIIGSARQHLHLKEWEGTFFFD